MARPTRRDVWLLVRVVFHLLFWSLMATWIVSPEEPSSFYRWPAFGGLGLIAIVALVPRLRRPVAAGVRRRIRPVDIVTFNLILLLLLTEGAVRLVAAFSSSPLFASADAKADERIRHHRGRPHGEHLGGRLNELGYFDTEFEVKRRPGVRRIAALADSFGPGVVPLEENYLTLLDVHLGEPTEVYNFGVSGIGPAEYLHLYRTEVSRFEPDVVLVSFFIGNDFRRHRARSILYADSLQSLALVQRLWRASGEAPAISLTEPDAPTFSEEAFRRIEESRLETCRAAYDDRYLLRVEETLRLLGELHQEAGARLRIVVIPDELQVSDVLWEELTLGRESEFDREKPNRLLREFCEARGISTLDLLAPLRAAERGSRTYKPRDTHWNRRGNAVAAEELARWLRD